MSSSQESETKVMGNKDPMPSDSKLASEDSGASSPESEDSEEFSFMLKPGEFMHDADSEIDHSLEVFTRTFCTKDTYAIFSDYSRIIRQSEEYSASNFEDHDLLNRYNDIPCFDSTRVSVKHPEEEHDYIHANYVDGFREPRKFILTQAPINDNLLLEQFWEMVWKEKVVEIVAMCVLDGVKCPQYLPVAAKQQRKFGPFIIQHIGTRQIRKAYDATMLLVKRENTNENEPIKKEPMRRILHLSFHRWPDKGTPIMPTEVINFIEDMNYNRDIVRKLAIADGWLSSENEITPIIVHCIAGVGRSGSLVALDICQRKMDYTSQLPSGPLINIERVVSRMRCQRAMAIQKPEQYLFLHFSIVEYALLKHYYRSVEMFHFSNYTRDEHYA